MMRAPFIFIFTILSLTVSLSYLYPDDSSKNWSDLDEGEHRIFGSEKEKKYPINAFIIEKEEWNNHYSFMFLWLYKYTDYPKYRSLRVIPIWYQLESKIDNRVKTVIPVLFYYHRIDGEAELTVTPLYYSNLKRAESDRAILYLLWWGSERGDYSRSYFFSPIFFKSRYEKVHSVEKGSTWINLLFYSKSRIYPLGDGTVSEQLNLSLLHYYSSVTKSELREYEKTWWAPILPLTYHHTSTGSGHRNFIGLLDYSWTGTGDAERWKRFWFIPFWFWRAGSEGYNWIVPPLYIEDRGSGGAYYRHLLPFFMKRKSIDREYSQANGKITHYRDLLITPVYGTSKSYRGAGWSGRPCESTLWWGPLVPLYYQHRDGASGVHRNVFWLYDTYENSEGEVTRRWLMPLYFSKRDSYKLVMPPLYISWQDEGGETYLGPVYYHHHTKYSSNNLIGNVWWSSNSQTGESSLHVFPLYFNWKNYAEETIMGPIYYRHKTPGSSSTLVFLFWRYYNWEHDNRSLHLFPFYFSWEERSPVSYSRSKLIPLLWYSSHHEYSSVRESTVINPLWYYSREISFEEKGEINRGTRLWIPLIPLIYSSYTTSEGAHRTLLLVDWKRGADGQWKRLWLFPLFFHEFGDSGHRYYLPFYLRPSGWTEERGLSFGIFPVQYHRWSPEEEVEWSWLLHYERSTPARNEEIYHWMPVYFSWQYRRWAATLVLPWKFEYRSRRKSLYINIIGISKSIASGPNPNVSLGIGKGEKGWYLDTDVSWLYDVFSISTRFTLKKPWEHEEFEIDSGTDLPVDGQVGMSEKESGEVTRSGVSIKEKKEFSREDSTYFWGWKVLFGWAAYERGDNKRHFRVVPLWWITWDKEKDDRKTQIVNVWYYKSDEEKMLFVMPIYWDYRSKDVEYFFIVPLYGKQVIGESFIKGYLLIAYWDEYDAERDLRERTVLWPLINWYVSPEQSGWRFLPLIWHREYREKGIQTSRTISLLYYGKERNRLDDGTTLYDFSISPIHYYREEIRNENFEKTWFFPIVPIFYYAEDRMVYKTEEPLVPMKDEDRNSHPPGYHRVVIEKSSLFLPLYYWAEKENKTAIELKAGNSRDFTLYGLPLLYYHRRDLTEGGNTDLPERRLTIERTFFLLGYYTHQSPELIQTSLLFGLYRNSVYPGRDLFELVLLYGLFKKSHTRDKSESHLIPIYSYHRSPEKWEFSILFGLYKDTEYHRRGDTAFKLLYGMFYTSLEHRSSRKTDRDAAYDTEEKTTWLFPLYYYNREESISGDSHYGETTHLFWLWYRHEESSGEAEGRRYDSTLWVPIIPLFYRHVTPQSMHLNVLGIVDVKSDVRRDYERTWVIPFYLRSTEGDEGFRYIFPLFYRSWDRDSERSLDLIWWRSRDNAKKKESNHLFPFYLSWKSPGESTSFTLGLYLHNSANYQRQNLLYLYDHQEYPDREFERYGFLFGLFDYQISPEIKRFQLFYGMLSSYTNYRNSDDYEFSMLWVLSTWKRRGSYYQSSLLPLWYYRSDEGEWSFLSPIGLTYLSKDRTGDFDLGLLGLIYYRNNNIPEHRDRRLWLMGILWNEVHRPERGYQSVGSLWGLLWEYEWESETRYSEISILKLVYKRVNMDGEVYHRIFGIKL
jgi:hypothetical protein